MSDQTNVVRIGRRVMPWFEAAFRTQALGERISWDLTFGAGQNDQGQMVPVFLVYAQLPAAQLGRMHGFFASVIAVELTQAAVEEAVGKVLAELHEMRRKELLVAGNHG